MRGLLLVSLFSLLAVPFSANAMIDENAGANKAQFPMIIKGTSKSSGSPPGCMLSFSGTVNQFKQDGTIVAGSTTDQTVQACLPVFQQICGDPKAIAQLVATAQQSTNTYKVDINSQDADKFCKTIATK